MELRTTKRTPLARAASIALRFSATSSGVGPHRRKTCSTPFIAAASEAGSPRSPVTVSIGGGKAADDSLDRRRARTDAPPLPSSSMTAEPILLLPPITKIITAPSLGGCFRGNEVGAPKYSGDVPVRRSTYRVLNSASTADAHRSLARVG